MLAIDKLVIFTLCLISGACAGNYCTVNGQYRYCSAGCCGNWYDNHCCIDDDAGRIIGIVVGCIVGVGAIITILVVVCCCCRKSRGASGQVMNPLSGPTTAVTTNTYGQTGVPMAAPVYPSTYPVGQGYPNVGYSQPYALKPGPENYNPPYPTQPLQGIQNPGFDQAAPQPTAPQPTGEGPQTQSTPNCDPPSYSDVL